mgnify:CR=1 FL=1
MPDSSTPRTSKVILYPAIDLKDGACVRLRRGDMNQATVFNDDPAAQAAAFADAGFVLPYSEDEQQIFP